MSATPPLPDHRRDIEQLRLLGLLHYIFAGLAVLAIGFLVLHYRMMHMFMSPEFMKGQPTPPPAGFFEMFIWFYVVFGVLCVLSGVLNLLAGRYLRTQRHRIFCMVIAELNCMQMPLGTVLGVFTLVVLNRDGVRQLFATEPDPRMPAVDHSESSEESPPR